MLVANHLSMAEPTFFFYYVLCTPVASADFAKMPGVGEVGRLNQIIWLDRADPDARRRTVETVAARANDASGRWPPVIVFPEGTTLNGKALISFKRGAFEPGEPVQPVAVTLPWRSVGGCGLDCSWTTAGPQLFELVGRMMLQPWNRMRVEFLPLYAPDAAEATNPALFARGVREAMSRAMRVPTTEHSWADMCVKDTRGCRFSDSRNLRFVVSLSSLRYLNMKARELGLPAHKTLVELDALRSSGGLDVDRHSAERLLRAFAAMDSDGTGGLTPAQFAAGFRRFGDEALADGGGGGGGKNGGPSAGGAGARSGNGGAMREILVRDDDGDEALALLFELLDVDERGILNFREFLVGFTLLLELDRRAPSDAALRLIFAVLARRAARDGRPPGRIGTAQLRRVFEVKDADFKERHVEALFAELARPDGERGADGDDADGDTVDVEAFIAFVRQNSEHVELKRERVFPSGGSLSSLHDGRAPGDALGARPHVAVAVAS